jgi:ATP-binding cassette subfamily B protein
MIIGIFQENLTGTRVVRIFRREEYETRRLTGAADGLYGTMMRLMRAISWFFPVTQLFAFAMTTIVVGVGGYDVIGGRLSLGELVAFSTYISILVGPLFGIGGLVFQIAGATASAGLINTVLDEPAPAAGSSERDAPETIGRLAYAAVSLRYPGNPVDTISDVSCTAEAGEIVALVGPTGSGKTSLIQLLPRFYETTGGRIDLDGRDIREFSIASLRDRIGFVPQSTWLMRGSIRDNIAFGRPDATMNEIVDAARWASAAGFIETLPMGYDTELGEAGSGLSGGQQQRIALARALIKRPPLLILDDATSALDAATERDVLDALRQLPFPCLRLMTTSRLAVVEAADRVLVLEQGRLTADGRHAELLETNQTYAALFGAAAEPEREDALR